MSCFEETNSLVKIRPPSVPAVNKRKRFNEWIQVETDLRPPFELIVLMVDVSVRRDSGDVLCYERKS